MVAKYRHRIAQITAHIIICAQERPCQIKAMLLAAGIDPRKSERVRPHLDTLRGMGLIFVHSWNRGRPLYAWQTVPWALTDVPKPPIMDRSKRMRSRKPAAGHPIHIMRPAGTWERAGALQQPKGTR